MSDDRQRLSEIEAWFEARGFLLVTDQSGKLWVAAVLRQDVRVGVGDVAGEGKTELEAAEAALAKYEALDKEGRRDVTIQVPPASVRVEGRPPQVRTQHIEPGGSISPGGELTLKVIPLPVELPFEAEAAKLAVQYGWRLGFIDEPDGQVRGFLMDWQTGDVLKSALGADFRMRTSAWASTRTRQVPRAGKALAATRPTRAI